MRLRQLSIITLAMSLTVRVAAQNAGLTMNKVNLTYIIREPEMWSGNSPMLILFHGYGSNERDIFSLFNSLPPKWIIVAFRAPLQLQIGQYAWYHVQQISGKIVINENEEEESRKQILIAVNELTERYRTNRSKLIVAGFSQGANIAEAVALSNPDMIAGFAAFSGRYLNIKGLASNNKGALQSVKAFIAHGSTDRLLPKQYLEDNISMLNTLGIAAIYSEDTTGHTISAKQYHECITWLEQFE